jgi:hypothetical protein
VNAVKTALLGAGIVLACLCGRLRTISGKIAFSAVYVKELYIPKTPRPDENRLMP